MPERIAGKAEFIKTAIAVGEWCEFDTRIYDSDSHISVWFWLDCGGGSMNGLKRIFELSDAIDFFVVEGRQLSIVCDYYTHEVWLKDRKVAPLAWDLFEEE